MPTRDAEESTGNAVLKEQEAHDVNSTTRFLLALKKSYYSIFNKCFLSFFSKGYWQTSE